MPIVDADQGIETPAYTDSTDGPAAFLALMEDLKAIGVRQYASSAARDAAIPTPAARMMAITGTGTGVEIWAYTTTWTRIYPEADTAWTAYTSTLTASTTNPTTSTAAGRYQRRGKLVIAQCNIVLTTAGTGNYSVALPVASLATASDTHLGTAWIYDSSASLSQMGVAVAQAGGTTCQIRAHGVTGVMSATTPWTWASGDAIRLNLMYEAA